jgi:surface antigen
MSKKLIAVITGSLLMACFVSFPVFAADDDDDAPKYKTKDVMKKAMKGGLLKKVAGGDASDDEKKQLHGMLVALGKNKPPKGEADSWKKLTRALAKAGKAAVDGDADAGAMLKKASNCKACHSKHKG